MALTVRMLRFMITFIAAFMGLYGMSIISFILIAHLCSLNSLGVPYMSPIAPFNGGDQRDTFIRFPIQFLRRRPRFVKPKSDDRQRKGENRGDIDEN
ncbi:Spore germination protein B1 [compost metagenome]